MNYFKKLARKWATRIVTYYYQRLYIKAVEAADARHAKEGETMYVIDHFIKGQTLSVINRREFRWIKHTMQKKSLDPRYWSADYGMKMLREQAWYHTPDRSGGNGLSAKQKEVRRIAFIRSGLKKARLY